MMGGTMVGVAAGNMMLAMTTVMTMMEGTMIVKMLTTIRIAIIAMTIMLTKMIILLMMQTSLRWKRRKNFSPHAAISSSTLVI